MAAKGIFISYRRSDSGGYAGRLRDELRRVYGPDAVFWDIDTVAPGAGLRERIQTGLADCGVLLAVIGAGWLAATDAAGLRRLDDPEDYVRREIAWALGPNSAAAVVPVLVDGAHMPRRADLPGDLQPLTDRAAVALENRTWDHDFGQIVTAIDAVLAAQASPPRGLRRVSAVVTRRLPREEPALRRMLLLVGAVAACVLAVLAYVAGALDGPENQTIDKRFSVRGAHAPASDIVIVGIDKRSLESHPTPSTWSRAWHARVIDRLRAAGVAAIGYDIHFDGRRPRAAAADDALVDAIYRAASVHHVPVVVAARFARSNRTGRLDLGFFDALSERFALATGATLAWAAVQQDPKTLTLRRIVYDTLGFRTFAVAVAERADRRTVDPSAVSDRKGWIDFAGKAGTYPVVSFRDVLRGRTPARALRGKIALVGWYDETIGDYHLTPLGAMSGVEVEANAIDTVRRNSPLTSAGDAIAVLMIVLLGCFAPLTARRTRPMAAALVAIAVGSLYLAAAQMAFNRGLIIPVAYPLLALGLGIAALPVVEATVTRLDRRSRLPATSRPSGDL